MKGRWARQGAAQPSVRSRGLACRAGCAYSLPARSFQKGVSFSEPMSSGLLK